MNKIITLIRKEWSEVFKNRMVFFAVAFMPILFTAIPLVMLYSMRGATDIGSLGFNLNELPPEFARVCGNLTEVECGQFLLMLQFMLLFLMLPVIIPVTIASYSIVGEKTTRTLEPLLATPITTIELLAGKALGAVIPAVVATIASFLIFAVGTAFLAISPAVALSLFTPMWLLGIFVVSPLLSIAGVSIAVMISSRVNDPRAAEQLSALVILPVVTLFIGQTLGLVQLNQTLMIYIAMALLIIDVALLYFATQLFQRETILTRWK
ncbi:MAG: ABC transporter permease subunit [Chloroflexi bacterium]|nr:ABC transporter permease subunit [Chloroflexota bacterium]